MFLSKWSKIIDVDGRPIITATFFHLYNCQRENKEKVSTIASYLEKKSTLGAMFQTSQTVPSKFGIGVFTL